MPKKYARFAARRAHRKNKSPGNGWKTIQRNKHTSKKIKLAAIAFGIIFTFLLIAQAVKFTKILTNPWKDSNAQKSAVMWNGDFNMNLIVRFPDQTSLLSFNPKEHKATIIRLPQNAYLDTAFEFGKWQLSSIYALGESQKDLGGGKLLSYSIGNLFGLPIDGVLYFSGQYSGKDVSEIVSETKAPFAIFGMLPYLKTNLTPFELIKLNLGLSRVRFDKINEVSLEDVADLLNNQKLLDGTEVVTVDTIKLDSVLEGVVDTTIKNEHKTIAIFNSTSHPGLAQKAARLITNIGGDVIITSNGQDILKNTQVLGSESKTLHRLKQIFERGSIIEHKSEEIVESRAEINVFLGEDYFE